MLKVLCTAAFMLSVSNVCAQDTTATPQSYTKIISDGSVSDSLLSIIKSIAQPHYIYNDSVIVERLEPSQPVRALLGLDQPEKEREMPADSLEKHGYMQKSLANGNNKNLSQSTQTDLQISGPIGGGFTVDVSILDSDMPVDDDGTTRQISELSSAQISVSKGGSKFSAGDIFLNQNGTDFINYNKKIKGFEFTTSSPIKKGKSDSVYVQMATASLKGRYRRQQINGTENSQGPYYLTSDNGEPIIVLTHTETVWLNGQKLTPGSDNDYTIDYNSGSITFTPKNQITAQSLITVDFEYSNSLYNSAFHHVAAGVKKDATKATVHYIAEYDKMPDDDADDSDTAAANLSPPKNKQYLALVTRTQPDSLTYFSTETVLLKNIENRFLPNGYYNDTYAGSYTFFRRFRNADTLRNTFAKANYKFSSKRFASLQSNKSSNFQRLWNIPQYTQFNQEQFLQLDFASKADSGLSCGVSTVLADIENVFRGAGNTLYIYYTKKSFRSGLDADCRFSENTDENNRRITAGYYAEWLKNYFISGAAYNIKSGSYNHLSDSADLNYQEGKIYSGIAKENSQFRLTALRRQTYFEDVYTSDVQSTTHSISAEYDIHSSDVFKLSGIEILKNIKQNIDSVSCNKSTSLTGRTQAALQLWNHQLKIDSHIESETGIMEKAGYTFLKTTAGNGYYVWNDYNQNGEQELNEFEKAFYKTDADYVKYYIHTGEYINTISSRYNINAVWNGVQNPESRFMKRYFLQRLYLNIILSASSKSAADNKFMFVSSGDSTLAQSSAFKLNAKHQFINNVWMIYGYSNAKNNRLTFYGTENDRQKAQSYGLETVIREKLKIQDIFTQGKETYDSEFFPEKNYSIDINQNVATATLTIKQNHEISTIYDYCLKRCYNSKAAISSLTTKYMFNSSAGYASASVSMVDNQVEGEENVSVTYQMLAGLNKGRNLVGSISICIKVAKYLQIATDFEIRKSKNSKTILGGILTAKVVLD